MNKILSLLSLILVVQIAQAQRIEPGLDKRIKQIFKDFNKAQDAYQESIEAAKFAEENPDDSKKGKKEKEEEPVAAPSLPTGEARNLPQEFPQDWRSYYWAANFMLTDVYALADTVGARREMILEVLKLSDRAEMLEKENPRNYLLKALAYTELSLYSVGGDKVDAINKAKFYASEAQLNEPGTPEYFLWMGRKLAVKENLSSDDSVEVMKFYSNANLLLLDEIEREDASPIFGFGVPEKCVNKLYPPLDEDGNPIPGAQTNLPGFKRLEGGQGTKDLKTGQTRAQKKMARDLEKKKTNPEDLSIKSLEADSAEDVESDEGLSRKEKKKKKKSGGGGGGSNAGPGGDRSNSFGSVAGKPRRM